VILAGATAFVAIESEILVRATETLVERFGLSQLFRGLVVIPLIALYALVALAVWFI
jgi:Ca2+/H+ antiporter